MNKRFLTVLAVLGAALIPVMIPSDMPADQQAITVRAVYPNPFTVGTTFQLTMPRPARVKIVVHDLLGKHVRLLRDEDNHPAGSFDVPWDGRDEAGIPVIPGVYICSLFSEDSFVTSVKVVKVQG